MNSQINIESKSESNQGSAIELASYMQTLGDAAKIAAAELAFADPEQKNQALLAIAAQLNQSRESILAANLTDLAAAKENDLSSALLERLELNTNRLDSMIDGLKQVAELADPVGEISELVYRPSGIQVGKMRVPLGVIGIIYESRPNVTVDAAALCLKSGNACILRGGKEAIHSNRAIYHAIQAGLKQAGMVESAVQVIETIDRQAVGMLLKMSESVDVIIPRGGKSLIKRVTSESLIPVIKHLDGNCHVYIDDNADRLKAIDIAINAKTRRFGVCNAMETLLIAKSIASSILPEICMLFTAANIELRACQQSKKLCPELIKTLATEDDWLTEYIAPILAIKVVDGIDHAIEHINHYGSHHTDAIVSDDYSKTRKFLRRVDSSSVMVNASTAFADGFEYGLGAEIGISTDKLHVRGPVGLVGLTSQKYVVFGDGHIRD